ncbi:glycosyl hydrolase/xylanase [Aspergillus heterothallicus]
MTRASGQCLEAYNNPVIWEDLPDPEVIRVRDVYYMSASSFAFSPGAPVLASQNLIDWKYIGHSVPELAFGERFYLTGQHAGAYVKGVWASSMRYRESNKTFYWYGAIQGTEKTYAFTAKSPGDIWTPLASIDKFYYDLGLLIDDDDSFYVAYGTKAIYVARLSPDGTKELESRAVYSSEEYLEGTRMYNIAGVYYIWLTRPSAGQYVLKSSAGPFGPYECREVIGLISSPLPGSGFPHQGALVDTPDGDWYYMAFIDGYPAGRIPVLAPVTFDHEGWPEVDLDCNNNQLAWKPEYPWPPGAKKSEGTGGCFKAHRFGPDRLDHCWEWNHNPDNSKWSVKDGRLLLGTGTVTDNLYLATNTLTHRTIGPRSMATFCIDWTQLADGDRAGACIFRDKSAYIGIHKDNGSARLVYVDDIIIEPFNIPVGWSNGHPVSLDWMAKSNGTVREEAVLVESRVWLRIKADVRAAYSHGLELEPRYTRLEYSFDGEKFVQLGPLFLLPNTADGYVGYRFALFSFATIALGGQLVVEDCEIESWD